MTIPTPADEALAQKIIYNLALMNPGVTIGGDGKVIAQLIAAHVAAQAPSGLVEVSIIEKFLLAVTFVKFPPEAEEALNNLCNAMNDAHKAQPVADVRGMVEEKELHHLLNNLECAVSKVSSHYTSMPSDANHLPWWSSKLTELAASRDEARARFLTALASARHALPQS